MAPMNGKARPFLNILKQKPLLAVFEVNLRCNSSCGYCDLPLNQGRYEMSRREINRVFTSLYAEGVRFVFMQGGEPTLRKDLLQIMRDLHDIGFIQTLVTNGTRIMHSFVQTLQTMPVSISISLDTLNRERYRRIRGADQLNIVLAGINRLRDYPHPKYITCIVSEENRSDVREVVNFARDHGFTPVLTPYHWNVGRYGRVDPGLQYDKEAVASLFGEILHSGLIPKGFLSGYVRDNINWLKGKSLGRCDAGRYSVSIDASGNVAACLAMEHAGNLLQTDLPGILKKMDMEKVRQCSDNSGCNVICNRLVDANLRHPIRALRSPDLVRTFSR
ncbi:MAG: radical SAM protein [Gammaproteobacteria bacterium]